MTLKLSNFSSVLPAVPAIALPALGAFAGKRFGGLYGETGKDVGQLLGGVLGGVGGQVAREQMMAAQQSSSMPAGAPYALDPSSEDIPPWALQGAQMMQPLLNKQSSAGGTADVIGSDVLGPLWPIAKATHNGQWGGVLPEIGMQSAKVLAGGLGGHLLGHGIEKLTGREISPIGVSLPTLLAGLGATVAVGRGT